MKLYLALVTYPDSDNPGAVLIEAINMREAEEKLKRWREDDPDLKHRVVWGALGALSSIDNIPLSDLLKKALLESIRG